MDTTSILLAGVGGQGTILAADVIAQTALAEGYQVKISEIHGMSQRGGSVTTSVCIGDEVNSMIPVKGNTDFLIAFETTEALRYIDYLSPKGFMLVNDLTMNPITVLTGKVLMPENPQKTIESYGGVVIPAESIALEAGAKKCSNIVMLGALSHRFPFEIDTWKSIIEKRVPPKAIAANLYGFDLGREFGKNLS